MRDASSLHWGQRTTRDVSSDLGMRKARMGGDLLVAVTAAVREIDITGSASHSIECSVLIVALIAWSRSN